MSLINTIALPLFIAFLGIIAVVALIGWIYPKVLEARARLLAQKRQTLLEQKSYEFIEKLYIEVCSESDVELTEELQDDLWKLHNQIDSKELVR